MRLGSLPLLLDFALFGFALLLRSRAQLGLVLLVSDFSHAGLSFLSRNSAWLGLASLASGMARVEASSPVLDFTQPEPFLLSHSFAPPDLAVLASDFLQLELPLSLRSSSQLDLSASALDLLHPGLLLPTRNHGRLGPAPLVVGVTCSGSSLAVSDLACLEPTAPIQSPARLGPAVLMPDFLKSGFPPSVHTSSRSGSLPPVCGLSRFEVLLPALDLAHLGAVLLTHDFACVDVSVLPSGMHRTGVSLLVPDSAHVGPAMLLRSLSCLGPALSALDSLHLELLLPTQGSTRMGFLLSAFGDLKFPSGFASQNLAVCGRVRFGFSPLILDWVTSGPALLPKSLACLEFFVLVLDFLQIGFSVLLHSSA